MCDITRLQSYCFAVSMLYKVEYFKLKVMRSTSDLKRMLGPAKYDYVVIAEQI